MSKIFEHIVVFSGLLCCMSGMIICDYKIWEFAINKHSQSLVGLLLLFHGICILMAGSVFGKSKEANNE